MAPTSNGKRKRAILLEAVSSGIQAETDKVSLPEQDLRLREIGASENWDIVDVILIPGFSRVYYNYPEFAQAALNEGIPAPMRMFEHWRKRDFDIFACVDGSRFGREQSIFAEVVSRTIDMGGEVFSAKDGYIHKGNYRMYISMGGYSAAGEIDELMRRKSFGMRGRAQKGLPTAPKLVPFLKYVLDDKGKQQGVVVNEDLRRLWDDLAEVILEGVPWRNVERVLYGRYGHTAPNGKPYRAYQMYEFLMNPAWWGHDALNHQFKDGARMKRSQPWVWDDSQPAPEGVQVFRSRHPAVYTGETAAKVKAELWRRYTTVKGRARPNVYRFTGLLVCDMCHCSLVVTRKPENAWIGWRCWTRWDMKRSGRKCDQRHILNDKKVQQYINENLDAYFKGKESQLFSPTSEPISAVTDQLARIDAELIAKRRARSVMMHEQSLAIDPETQAGYREMIADASAHITILEQRRFELDHAALETQQAQADMDAQLADIEKMTLPVFWEQEPGTIHRQLHRALGKKRIVVRDGAIAGTIAVQRKRGTY